MPQNLWVEKVADEFALRTSWDAPSDNGGSQVVSYTVQIREVVENNTGADFTALTPLRVIDSSQVQFAYTIRDLSNTLIFQTAIAHHRLQRNYL